MKAFVPDIRYWNELDTLAKLSVKENWSSKRFRVAVTKLYTQAKDRRR